MEFWEAAILGAAAMLLAVVLAREAADRLAEYRGYAPTSWRLREVRQNLFAARRGQLGGLSPGLATSVLVCLAEGHPATLYGWVDGAPMRLCSYGDLREPPLTTRLAANLPTLEWGEICSDAHGTLVPLRSEAGHLTGVLVLGPGQPPHPDKAGLLATAGDLLYWTLQPEGFDDERRNKHSDFDPVRRAIDRDTSPSGTTPDAARA